MHRARHLSVALIALAGSIAVAPGAALAGWPTPAAGSSASGQPEVLFTFDDGPDPKWSGQILDTLAAHHVQAIFFWVGRRIERNRPVDRKRKALVERVLADGHLLGNHTIHHVHLCSSEGDEAAVEIDRNRSLYESLTRFPMVLFRTPYGDNCRRLRALLGERQLTHLHWDIDAREYLGLSSESTAAFIIGKIKRLRGRAVVLMHDTQGASARALPIILKWIEAENRRRSEKGGRVIRILSASDFVVEKHATPLWAWWQDAAAGARRRVGLASAGLVPGAPAPGALTRR